MKFFWTKNKTYLLLLLFHIFFGVSTWLNINHFFLQLISAFLFLLILPGLYIERLLKLELQYEFQSWSIRIGFSIFYLMFIGLITNLVLPFLNIPAPLKPIPLLLVFSFTNTVLLIFCYCFSTINRVFYIPQLNKINKLLILFSILLIILGFTGAVRMNNGGDNILTMLLLGLSGVSVFIVSVYYHRIRTDVLAFYIFSLGASTLLMFSLRSNYISGFDISREFFLFQLTKLIGIWDISNFRDAYNACLSITILPTILSYFMPIRDENIYKFIYPLLFAFVPVNMFFIAKKFTNELVALLASVFFISHPWFIDPMVTLTRQEMGFLFFSLLIMTIFSEELTQLKRTIIYTIVAASLVVSHYSTTYIAVILITGAYIATVLLKSIFKILQKTPLNTLIQKFKWDALVMQKPLIKIWYVIILLSFTYLWLSVYTGAANNISDFFKKTIKNIANTSIRESRSGLVNQVLTGKNNVTMDTYSSYYNSKIEQYKFKKDIYQYPKNTYIDYKLTPRSPKSLPITSPFIFNSANILYKALIISIQIFFIGGVILSLFLLSDKFKIDYFVLVFISIFMLMAITFLPYVSQEYNFDRLYLQTMLIMSMFAVIGGMSTLHLSSRYINIPYYILPVCMTVLMYWYSFGFIWQIVGGKTVLWLNNYGFYYDMTYTHQGEIVAGHWLMNKYNKTLVYTSVTGRNILSAYTNIFTFNSDVLPATIDRNSYVYLTKANVVDRISYFYLRGLNLGYNFPYDFLEENKNKIYSNSVSEIYR